MNKIIKRSEINIDESWDLHLLYKDESDFISDTKKIKKLTKKMKKEKDIDEILKLIEEYKILREYISSYAELALSVDYFNKESNNRYQMVETLLSKTDSSLQTLIERLKSKSNKTLKKYSKNKKYKKFIKDIIRKKKYSLSEKEEKLLISLSPILDSQYNMYNTTKMTDIKFEPFNGLVNSFVLFENKYQTDRDTNIRREAFNSFSNSLKKYKNTIGNYYINQVKKEKIISDLRGYESVFDYLLDSQNIDRLTYDLHIDTVMEKLKKPMRKWATLIKETYKLENLYFEDLKAPIDPDYSPELSIEKAKEYAINSLSIMGEEYKNKVKEAIDNRWIDWAQNEGKSTGGFCASPYKKASFILLSWTNKLSEVFTLVHELGHAMHFYFANKNNYFNYESSLYFIEAPSTINELLFSHYLDSQSDDKRFKRFVKSTLISNTYYHNFVTHFLEAYYQREVYRLIDKYENIDADTLCRLKKETLKKFWGDSVTITDNASLTWMRQPHYYMGLYPYTYSAGLNIATQVATNIFKDNNYNKKWIKTLKKGGSLNPKELCKYAGVDITNTEGLTKTIDYIESLIDDIVLLSK